MWVFSKGAININFKDNIIGYTAGDTVLGTIDVVLDETMLFKDLIIEFVGVERCFLISDSNPQPFHRDVKEIVRLSALVKTFDGELKAGQH